MTYFDSESLKNIGSKCWVTSSESNSNAKSPICSANTSIIPGSWRASLYTFKNCCRSSGL